MKKIPFSFIPIFVSLMCLGTVLITRWNVLFKKIEQPKKNPIKISEIETAGTYITYFTNSFNDDSRAVTYDDWLELKNNGEFYRRATSEDYSYKSFEGTWKIENHKNKKVVVLKENNNDDTPIYLEILENKNLDYMSENTDGDILQFETSEKKSKTKAWKNIKTYLYS